MPVRRMAPGGVARHACARRNPLAYGASRGSRYVCTLRACANSRVPSRRYSHTFAPTFVLSRRMSRRCCCKKVESGKRQTPLLTLSSVTSALTAMLATAVSAIARYGFR